MILDKILDGLILFLVYAWICGWVFVLTSMLLQKLFKNSENKIELVSQKIIEVLSPIINIIMVITVILFLFRLFAGWIGWLEPLGSGYID